MDVGIRPRKMHGDFVSAEELPTMKPITEISLASVDALLDTEAICGKFNSIILHAVMGGDETEVAAITVNVYGLEFPLSDLSFKELSFVRNACNKYCERMLAKATTTPEELATAVFLQTPSVANRVILLQPTRVGLVPRARCAGHGDVLISFGCHAREGFIGDRRGRLLDLHSRATRDVDGRPRGGTSHLGLAAGPRE